MNKNLSFELPLPPSINKLYVWNKYIHQKVYKKIGTDYLTVGTLLVQKFVKKYEIELFKDYFYLDLDFYLSRRNTDSHNLHKLIFDVLEHGGLVENDKWIMNRTQSVNLDKKNPRVKLTIPRS